MKEEVTEFGKQLAGAFHEGELRVADDLYTRRVYSKDLWPRNLIIDREEGLKEPTIDAVIWPINAQVLSHFVKLANQNNWEIFPYGAGSGVCGGATPDVHKQKKRVVVDLKKMDQIESIDEISLVAKVQAGIMGQVLEEDLNAKGYTLGHFPSSIYCSSFGGYLATRAAGQLSTYYGKIEDMVLAVEGVLPEGDLFSTVVAPRMATGPQWTELFLGTEGSFGFLTAAWAKIHPLPQSRKFISYEVESLSFALEGVRKWLQAGLRPAAIRIYDEDESRLLMGLKTGVKLISIIEGNYEFSAFTENQMHQMAKSWEGWKNTGEEPAQQWWEHRYDVSYKQQLIMSHNHMILDTFEVSATWSKLFDLHKAIKQVAHQFEQARFLVILAHFSHFYHTGGNIYFTLCGKAANSTPTTDFYDKLWDTLLSVCEKQQAAISHHHGLGRLKAHSYQRYKPELYKILEKLKHELDPKHLFNPKNLGL